MPAFLMTMQGNRPETVFHAKNQSHQKIKLPLNCSFMLTSSQDGGVHEQCLPPPMTASKLQLNCRATITENHMRTRWIECLQPRI